MLPQVPRQEVRVHLAVQGAHVAPEGLGVEDGRSRNLYSPMEGYVVPHSVVQDWLHHVEENVEYSETLCMCLSNLPYLLAQLPAVIDHVDLVNPERECPSEEGSNKPENTSPLTQTARPA